MRKWICLLALLLNLTVPLCVAAQDAGNEQNIKWYFQGRQYTDNTTSIRVDLLDCLLSNSELLDKIMPSFGNMSNSQYYEESLRYNFTWSFHDDLIEDEQLGLDCQSKGVFRSQSRYDGPYAVYFGADVARAKELVGKTLFTCTITRNNSFVNNPLNNSLPENTLNLPITISFVMDKLSHVPTAVESVPNDINTYYTVGNQFEINRTKHLASIGSGETLYYKWFLMESKVSGDDEELINHGMIGDPTTVCSVSYMPQEEDHGRWLECYASTDQNRTQSADDAYVGSYYMWNLAENPVIMPEETRRASEFFVAPGESYTIRFAPAKSTREGVPVRYRWYRSNPDGGGIEWYTDEPSLTVTYGKEAIDLTSFSCYAGYGENMDSYIAYDELVYCGLGETTSLPGGMIQAHYPIDLNKDVGGEIAGALEKESITGGELQSYMQQKLEKNAGLTQGEALNFGGSELFNVNLHQFDKDRNVHDLLTAENFPEKGVKLMLPYPDGTNGREYVFHVAHIFGEDCNGYSAGDVECMTASNEEKGISFTVNGTSPMLVSWVYTGSPEGMPQTGDESMLMMWLGLAAMSAALLLFRRRRA